jgi:hypothetical protein
VTVRTAGRALAGAAAAVAAALALVPAGQAAGGVAVVVRPTVDPAVYAGRGAVGLLVPGAGSTVTREGALSALVRGRVVSSLLGGKASGAALIRLSERPAAVTVYVSLPPSGRSHNTRRYPIAIVGGGYHGLLVSRTTRVPGLVSVADVAPTVTALEQGRRPVVRFRADGDAAATLADLDRRLRDAHDGRNAATIVLVAEALALAGAAFLLRNALLARAGLLALPAALANAEALSAAGGARPAVTTVALAVATPLAALAAAARRAWLVPALAAFLAGMLVVLAAWPEVNALAVIGPHPDGGGRYYGVTNEVETLLLAPVLALAAALPAAGLVPVAALALALVGWSRAGADGGGVVVVLVALTALWLLRRRVRPTARRVAIAAVAVVAVALALVGLDAASGGSSHVTGAVGSGPGSLLGDLGHRLRLSWHGATATLQAKITILANLAALAVVGLPRRRVAAVDALLVALLASLLVNDSPTDVIGYGALCGAVLRVWGTVDARATGRSAEPVFLRASPEQPWR